MKRMVYIVIALAGVVVVGVIFAGCAVAPDTANTPQLTGLSLTQNHMNFGYCYSFYLREEDDRVLFDAEVRFDAEPYCITLENCQVDKAYLEELKNLDKEHKITDYVISYRKKPSIFSASDETVNKTTVYLSDKTDKSADTDEAYKDDLYNFFFELAKTYSDKSVAVYTQ